MRNMHGDKRRVTRKYALGNALSKKGIRLFGAMAASNEAAKLQQHLELLKEQYVRLQQRHGDLEQKYTQAVASSGSVGPDHFVTKLVGMVTGLYEKQLYSDITIQLADRSFPGHRFVLATRSPSWSPSDETLGNSDSLDLSHLSPHVAVLLLRWIYTDAVFLPADQSAVVELLSATNQYQLGQLKEKCEQSLISSVTVRNCIRLYQTSEEHNAGELKRYCLQIISNHWNDLDTADFADLSAPLLYDMFKAHSKYPLHLAIQHQREDVVFMFIIEHNSELPQKLDELDDRGTIPLNLALINKNEGIANTLVSNRCNLDVTDKDGNTLLHLAIARGDIFAANFLIKNGASTILCKREGQATPLHLVAQYNRAESERYILTRLIKGAGAPADDLVEIGSLLLQYHANLDAQDSQGYTPLHRAIEKGNTPIFEIFLEHQVINLELRNNSGSTALWLALTQLNSTRGESDRYAARLIERGSTPNAIDSLTGNSLLHQAALESNERAAIFLVCHGANVDHVNHQGESPMHVAAAIGLHNLIQVLLQYGADPNLQTNLKKAPPSISIPVKVVPAQTPPVSHNSSDLISPTSTLGALSVLSNIASTSPSLGGGGRETDSFASQQLLQLNSLSTAASCDTSPVIGRAGPPAGNSNPFGDDSDEEETAPPIRTHGYGFIPSGHNSPRMSPVPPARQAPPPAPPTDPGTEFIEEREPFDSNIDPGQRTALHLAIAHKHHEVVKVMLQYKESGSASGKLEISLNVGLRDGGDETPLSLSLWTNQLEVALSLLDAGADIECQRRSDNMTLLYQAIVREQASASLFLLDHGSNFRKRTSNNETLLLVAIKHQLEPVADRLCDLGAEVGVADAAGNSPLWVALRSRQESIAAKLITHGCDPNAWHTAPDGTSLSLLHRAIILQDPPTACFLIKSGADVNSATRPSESSPGSAGFSPPLHMACQRGLDSIVQCLVDHHADPNAKDSQACSPLHIAITTRHPKCAHILLQQPRLDLSVKDNRGSTPFAAALATKDNETGLAILKKEPKAAEQMDNKGQNFLHLAVLNQDVESVIFLLSVAVDVNSKVQNPTQNTPLHYAIKTGSEILVRHLLLAMANVKAVDNHNRSVLHLAVEGDFSSILSVLLEHGANPDHADEEGNNALHIAMQLGHENCVKVLLTDSDINLTAANVRGRNCLHMLSASPKHNASSLFHLLRSAAAKFPVNAADEDGYTPLLLAYVAGSSSLCEGLIAAGAHPGMCSKQGLSIFNAPVATKQLLFRILDQIQTEPSWLDGQHCMNCSMKFNISHRKHHCRHCGRLLCNKCTSQQMPIVKFELNKSVRVCEVCGDSFKISSMR